MDTNKEVIEATQKRKHDVLSENTIRWNLRVYEESWKQYTHEDDLMEKRNQKFLSLQTLLLGFVGGIFTFSTLVFKFLDLASENFYISIFAFTIVILAISILATRFLSFWEVNNHAGEEYLNLRLRTIVRIEENFINEPNLGISEISWRDEYFKKGKKLEGFGITEKIIKYLKAFWFAIIIIDLCTLIFSIVKFWSW